MNLPTSRGTAFAAFDAWRYDGDSLRREFIREVADQLVEAKALPKEFDQEDHTKSFDVDIATPRDSNKKLNWKGLVPALMAAVGAAAVIVIAYFALPIFGLSDKSVVKVEITLLGALTAFVLVAVNRVIVPAQVQETRRRFEYPDEFAGNFRALLKQVGVERLVIGIDNLDRCSPKRVAEILSTVKTFLEPALEKDSKDGAKSLCFVIAADDEALRRHLTAEEMTLTAAAPNRAGEEEAVRDAVNEYLRKFFNASIRITDMLDEDMRAFTAREIADFVDAHEEIDDIGAARLVEVTAQGLKRNPRRLKQFVNNLELRLQLFSDRRAAGRMQMEPDVLMMAKLVILEEEFPDKYRELRKDPTLLAKWHEQAAGSEGQEGLGQELVGFLRSTTQIQSPSIRAYLSSKQTEDERKLPRYREFVDLLDDGNADALGKLLEDVGSEQSDGYVAAAGRYFDTQVRDRAWNRAQNTMRAVIEVPTLRGENGSKVAHVLKKALDHPLRDRLPQLDPQSLLRSAKDSLDAQTFVKVLEVLLSALTDEESPNRNPGRLFSALAAISEDLEDASTSRIRMTLENESIRQDFESYVDLAEAKPEVVGPEAALSAVVVLEQEGTTVESTSPPVRVALAALGRPAADAELADRFLNAVRGPLNDLRQAGDERYRSLSEAIVPVIPSAANGSAPATMAQELEDSWGNSTPNNYRHALDLGLALCRSSEAADAGAGAALGRRVLEVGELDDISEWVRKSRAQMPEQFKAGFTDRLRLTVAGAESELDSEQGRAIAEALPAGEMQAVLERAAEEAIENDRLEVVEPILPKLDRSPTERVMEKAVARVEENADALADRIALVEFVIEHQAELDQGQRERFARVLVAAPKEQRDLCVILGPMIGRLEIEDAGVRHELVDQLIGTERDIQAEDRREAVLRGADSLAGRIPSNARTLIDARLREMVESQTQPDQAIAERIMGAQ